MSGLTVEPRELLELMARALVDKPDSVDVVEEQEGDESVYYVEVDPEDVGKIVGKEGRTVRALRTIMDAAGRKFDRKFAVEVPE